jgi:hypothetical protein
MRLLGLVVSMGVIFYLVTAVIGKQNNSRSDTKLLDRPEQVKTQVNKALETTEKARQDALNQSTSTSN